MESLLEYGDPDELLLAEDLVILIMRESWKEPPGGCMAEGLHFDTTRRTLTTNQRGLSVNRSLFGQNNIATAVFAGCEALESSTPFRLTAKHVLQGTDTLVIVHNRDTVWNLADWFPRVKKLLLPHNIRLQFDEELRRGLPDRKSDLEELLGSSPAMGSTDLYFNRNALTVLLHKCCKLRHLETSLHGDMLSGDERHIAFALVLSHETLSSMTEVRLDCYVERLDGSPFLMDRVSEKGLLFSQKFFSCVTHLEVTMMNAEVVPGIGKFSELTTLVAAFSFNGVLLDFAPGMESVLGELPLLEELSLNYFAGVNVATIARICPRVRRLSLIHCSLTDEEIADTLWDTSPPRSLEFLRLNVSSTLRRVVKGLIMSCRCQIKALRLDDPTTCFLFLRCATKTTFDHLERLMLHTDASARGLLREEEYTTVVRALPALKHLTTDSYDLRLLFSHLPSTRKITLAWCTCTVCAAEFPRVNKEQNWHWSRLQNSTPAPQCKAG